jgi:hypothetical protein
MAEWLNAAVLKTVKDASPSGVRIPVSPQDKNVLPMQDFFISRALKTCFYKRWKLKK